MPRHSSDRRGFSTRRPRFTPVTAPRFKHTSRQTSTKIKRSRRHQIFIHRKPLGAPSGSARPIPSKVVCRGRQPARRAWPPMATNDRGAGKRGRVIPRTLGTNASLPRYQTLIGCMRSASSTRSQSSRSRLLPGRLRYSDADRRQRRAAPWPEPPWAETVDVALDRCREFSAGFGCAVASGESRRAENSGQIRGAQTRSSAAQMRGGGTCAPNREEAFMTDISQSMRIRGAIVAAAGIFIGALCQASLMNSARCPRASPGFRTADDATRPQLSSRNIDGLTRACAALDSRLRRPHAVEPKFLHAVEIAGAQLPSN